MAKPTVFYIHQYGSWWRLTPAQWIACCETGSRGEGYTLPGRSLGHRPGQLVGATHYGSASGDSYFALRDGVEIREPLDWEPEAFAEELTKLGEK